jgi:hypothetical protein
MSNKISKKDQDPNQIDKDREALAQLSGNESQHFKVGTAVVHENRRATVYEVVATPDGTKVLMLSYDDGTHGFVVPYALNRT